MAVSATSFKPGQSGNPKGRPRKPHALTDQLRLVSNKRDENGLTHKRKWAEKMWALAEAGDLEASQLIIDRLDGSVIQEVQQGGEIVVKVINGVNYDDI